MRAALVVGMVVCLAACVAASLAGTPVLSFSAAFGGLALLAVAIEHPRPRHWSRAENEHSRHRDN